MQSETRPAGRFLGRVLLALAVVLAFSGLHSVSTHASIDRFRLQAAFRSAALEFHVPEDVLLAVAYNETRWDDHGGAPSTAGGYGPMHLTHVVLVPEANGRGTDNPLPLRSYPSPRTLDIAAHLIHQPIRVLERDTAQNIRGGAALLALYARQTTGGRPSAIGAWYGSVARYSGSSDRAIALDFADAVYTTIRTGAARRTLNGQQVVLRGRHVAMERETIRSLHLRPDVASRAECPRRLACPFVPAAYALDNPRDPTDYGNYDVANRAGDGLAIRYIVIHDTESTYSAAIQGFQNPTRYASANYVIRSSDGRVTQMVPDEDVAWHAGNYYVNSHAIGIEHEGVAVQGATWYGEQMYQASARLVRYLAHRYSIPLDRAHIIGHDEVPGPTPATQTSQHWDPGPFWDWAHYMDLLKAPLESTGDMPQDSGIVTINPDFSTNQPAVTYCYTASDCRPVTAQPSNFVYLRTAPQASAPLLSDPALRAATSPGSTRADDWGDKAVTGQEFYRVGRQGDWDAIYYGGKEAWYYNPGGDTATVPATGDLVTPRHGKASIPVYGRAYPERSAFPWWIPRKDIEKIVPLQYAIHAGQRYVVADRMAADYYWSPTQTKRAVVRGKTRYYQIFFNHRFAFVSASDVRLIPAPVTPTPTPSPGTATPTATPFSGTVAPTATPFEGTVVPQATPTATTR